MTRDLPATFGIPRETDWIEAYDRDRFLSVPCARMPRYTASVAAAGEVEWCADTGALRNALAGLIAGRPVIVTLGDSNTASARAWPRRLARLSSAAPIVVNIANMAETAEQGIHRLASLLAWPALGTAADVAVVYLGGINNCAHRTAALTEFLAGNRTDFALACERDLARLPGGRRLARLIVDPPADEAAFPAWIARRAVAGVRALAETATATEHRFYAVVQPLCYPDLVPSYGIALRRAQAEGTADTSCADADAFFGLSLRPALDQMRAIWGATFDVENAVFADWATLFAGLDPGPYGERWYQESFDAVHYSDFGYQTLASCINLLVAAREPFMPPLVGR
jgi:hypothetical protein